jgi:hypothetical protein
VTTGGGGGVGWGIGAVAGDFVATGGEPAGAVGAAVAFGATPEPKAVGSAVLDSSDAGASAVRTVASCAYLGACRAGGAMAHPIAPIMQLAAIARRTSRDVTVGLLRFRRSRRSRSPPRSRSCRGG